MPTISPLIEHAHFDSLMSVYIETLIHKFSDVGLSFFKNLYNIRFYLVGDTVALLKQKNKKEGFFQQMKRECNTNFP